MALTKVTTGVVDDSVFAANKNVIINGNFDIWQRGTSFIAPASTNYTTDRFLWGFEGTGVVDILQSTSVPDNTSEFSVQVDVTTADTSIAAGDNYAIQTRIEGYDIERFGFGSSDATSLTLSFWVLSSKTGIHCISLKNDDSTRSFIIEYTVNVADTWEYKTNTLTADTTGTWLANNGTGIKIIFNLAVGSTFQTTAGSWTAGNFLGSSNQVNVMDSTANNFHLSQVQLEVGSVATAFERRSFAQELTMAKRYFERMPGTPAFTSFGAGQALSTTIARVQLTYMEKRIDPTVSVSAASDFFAVTAAGAGEDVTVLTAVVAGVKYSLLAITVAANLVAGDATRLGDDGGGNSFIDVDAEL